MCETNGMYRAICEDQSFKKDYHAKWSHLEIGADVYNDDVNCWEPLPHIDFNLADHIDKDGVTINLPILGRGAEKTAYLYQHNNKKYVALYPLSERELRMQKLFSPYRYFLKLFDAVSFKTKYGKSAFIAITEFCPSSIEKKLAVLKDDSYLRLKYMTQLIEAVSFMHENNVAHLSIKSDNVLIGDDVNIRVADFGDSRILSESLDEHMQLHKEDAQETLQRDIYMFRQNDIRSLANLFLEMLMGETGYTSGRHNTWWGLGPETDMEQYMEQREQSTLVDMCKYLEKTEPAVFVNLLRSMTQTKHADRPTMQKVKSEFAKYKKELAELGDHF